MTETTNHGSQQGFPLVALFLLIAVAATVIAQLALMREIDVPTQELSTSVLVNGVSGIIFGLIVGLHDFRRTRGGLFGPLIGLIVGAASGPIAVAASEEPWIVIGMAAASGAGLLLMTTVYRMVNTNDPVR